MPGCLIKGLIIVDKEAKSEEELFDIALEAGAKDMKDDGDVLRFTALENFETVHEALKTQELSSNS